MFRSDCLFVFDCREMQRDIPQLICDISANMAASKVRTTRVLHCECMSSEALQQQDHMLRSYRVALAEQQLDDRSVFPDTSHAGSTVAPSSACTTLPLIEH